MSAERELLRRTADIAADFIESLAERPVRPEASVEEMRRALGGPLQEQPCDPREVIDELSRAAEPGLAAMGSGRYFGFVIGGAVPAALAADMLTSAWDQNAALALPTPAAAVVEEVVGAWLAELLGIPGDASFALVTGCQMAHATCLAAARHHVLAQVGHEVERAGLAGAPRSASSRAPSGTGRSIVRSGSSGSAPPPSGRCRSTTRGGCSRALCSKSSAPAVTARRSCACRPER